jgi:uncharacterized phage-associated protein
MNEKILKNIDYIACVAGMEGYQLTITRFVKFLYLAEILYLQYSKERLTNWEWIFWDYGPYCTDSLNALDVAVKNAIIISTNYSSKFDEESDFKLIGYPKDRYKYQEDLESHIAKIEKDIPVMVRIGMKQLIKKYGGNTSELLNYVYFKTEPMKAASPRSKISFDHITQTDTKLEPIKVTIKNVKKMREAITRMKSNMLNNKNANLNINVKYIDADYIVGMEALNRLDDNDDISESGIASILTLSRN